MIALVLVTVAILVVVLYQLCRATELRKKSPQDTIEGAKNFKDAASRVRLGMWLLALATALVGYLIYQRFFVKHLSPLEQVAKQLLEEQDPDVYSNLCDQIFKAQPPVVFDQYLAMKAARPRSEVNNLCGNLAKQILKIK